MFRFSFFSGFFSNQAQKCTEQSWDTFCTTMKRISEVEGYKPSSDDYENEQPLISSAIYGENTTRCNKNVIGWESIMLDIDDTTHTLEHIQNYFNDYNYIIYSSASCTKDKLKIRVIIPLDEFAPSDVLSQIWHGCNEWCDSIVDPQTKDKSRMVYQPARYTNKGKLYNHIFIINKGKNLNWRELIEKYPSPREADRFKKQNALSGLKRKIYLNSKTAPIMDIRNRECPFVYPQMVEDYMLTPAGGHHKAIYVFMLRLCSMAQKLGYPLSIDELVDMAKQLDELDGSYYNDKKMYDSAQDALEFTGV